ncbi:Mobile element protein [Pseudomonas synxantha]|nr:Mobile element protein [Pseudomonas synxantha]AZE78057.1 Mobile element protein [Pseudomonas synxantha]
MMKQMTFADAEYAGKRKQTRKELFLIEMDQVVPWKGLIALIEPYYPKGEGGRPAYPLMSMLRVHLMQNWFGYSDPAMEEALYEIAILRQFSGLSLERIPDETTILNFRRLLEKHELATGIIGVINGYLCDRSLSRSILCLRLIITWKRSASWMCYVTKSRRAWATQIRRDG